MVTDALERGFSLTRPLDVNDLPETGLKFEEGLDAAFVETLLGDATRRGAVRFEVLAGARATLTALPLSPEEPPPVRLNGELVAELRTTCVRCLEVVELRVTAPIEVTVFPDGDPLAGVGQAKETAAGKKRKVEDGAPLEPWAEIFPEPEKLAEEAYDGRVLPLPQVLQQALLIELPADPACVDTVACDARTKALIHSANAASVASDAEGDPRWAALKALRAAATDEEGDDPAGKR